MRIDYDYLSRVLNVFLESDEPTVTWMDFRKLHGDEDAGEKKLAFHLALMRDRNLVVGVTRDGGLAIHLNGDGSYRVSIVPWRLTAEGHDFATSLAKPGILKTIMTKFAKEGLDVTKSIAVELAKKEAIALITAGS